MRRLTLIALCATLVLLASSLAGAAPTAKVKPVLIPITVAKGKIVGGIKRPKVKKGKLVRIIVTTDVGESIHLHGYDITKPVLRGKKVVIQFTARLTGRFEVEMHRPDVVLAVISVTT
ncbi:MAG: hypothetical protein ACKVUT_17235 [Gaiella sp.]